MARSMQCSTALAAAALFAGSVGCVTKGNYDALAAERDQLQAERDTLEANRVALEEKLDELTVSNKELSSKLSATEEEVAELKGTYDSLVVELQNEVAAGQIEIQQLVDGVKLNVADALLFPSGSAQLDEGGRDVLERVASQIKDENSIVSVEGHTDNVRISSSLKKRYPTNWELAGARAAIVSRALSENGVDPKALRAVSRGPFAPVASNDTPEGRAKNRRTEIIVRPMSR